MYDSAIICVDTTEVFKSPRLNSAGWPELLARSRSGSATIVVSEVVVREATRQFPDHVGRALKEANAALAGLENLDLGPAPTLEALQERSQQAILEYESWLRKKLLDNEVMILPLPQVTHDDVLRRDLTTKKPFAKAGKGYRDTLIWESWKEYLAKVDSG